MRRVLPSALYLKHTSGDAIGPLSMTAVEVLFDSRVVTSKTPISFDGERYSAIEEWPEILRRLESIKTQLNEGQNVWDDDPVRAPSRGTTPAAPVAPPRPATPPKALARPAESTMVGRMLRIAAKKRSGLLRLTCPEGSLSISYKDGSVAAVSTDLHDLDIAAYLLRTKALDAASIEAGVTHAPKMGGDLGGALISMGKIQPHVYFEKFIEWAKELLGAAVARTFTTVEFEEGEQPAPPFPLGLDRLGVPVQAVRAGLGRGRLSEILMPKRPCPLIISQVDGVKLEEVKLKPRELRALKGVNGVKTLGELIDDLGGSEEKSLPILQAVHFAEQAGFVVFGDDPLHRKEAAEAQEILAQFERLDKRSYFEVLGVSEQSSDEEVRSRYADYAKKYHPDKIRAEAAPVLLEARRKLFALVSEAADALETEAQRYKYAHDLEQGFVGSHDAMEKVQASLQSETHFKKAEILLRVRKYAEAQGELEMAIKLNPDDTEFKILREYIVYLVAAKQKDGEAVAAEKATRAILGLMKLNANIASGYLYLGHLQNALGKEELALKYFEKVLEYDEHHPEATSQVRVGRMRKDRKKKKRWG